MCNMQKIAYLCKQIITYGKQSASIKRKDNKKR